MFEFEYGLPFNLTFDLIATADVIAAIVATGHVLLHKRDVRAAIGWIGLAWLSPFLGSLLYFVFGINRVVRRAARLRRRTERIDSQEESIPSSNGIRVPQENILAIEKVGDRVIGSPIISGNAVSIFRNGDEAYPAMLAAIRDACRTIALSSYIFRTDHVGAEFIAALTDARQRGVEVRVLVDGIGSGYLFSKAAQALHHADIRVERFLHDWKPWRMPFLNMRNHKKILVIDGTIGFTGGLNLGAENMACSGIANAVEDVHFKIDGPVVSKLMQSFADDWVFTCDEALEGDGWWPDVMAKGEVFARGISSGPDDDEDKLEIMLAAAVGSAKKRLRIVTPYFLPDQRLMSDIALASLRGVDVEVIVPEQSNRRIMDWAMRSQLGFFATPEIKIYMTPMPFDHSKLVTVDGHWCGLGSPNWDLRSLRLNFEFMLEFYNDALAHEIDKLIDKKIAGACRLSLDSIRGRGMPQKLRDASARLLLPYL